MTTRPWRLSPWFLSLRPGGNCSMGQRESIYGVNAAAKPPVSSVSCPRVWCDVALYLPYRRQPIYGPDPKTIRISDVKQSHKGLLCLQWASPVVCGCIRFTKLVGWGKEYPIIFPLKYGALTQTAHGRPTGCRPTCRFHSCAYIVKSGRVHSCASL